MTKSGESRVEATTDTAGVDDVVQTDSDAMDETAAALPYTEVLQQMRQSARRQRSLRLLRQSAKKAKMFLQRQLIRKLKNAKEHLEKSEIRLREDVEECDDVKQLRVAKMARRVDRLQSQMHLAKVRFFNPLM